MTHHGGTAGSARTRGTVGSGRRLFKRTVFSPAGQAIDNPDFVVAPASFNAIAADAATTLGELIGDSDWIARGGALAAALDERSWDAGEELWSDVAFTGGGASVRIPTM